MKYFKRLSAALLLLFPLLLSAQSNYKPGYVVTTKGDTVRGFINFRDWDSNPSAISFKPTQIGNDKKSFGLSEISYFNITGVVAYKKFICSISLDEVNSGRLSRSRDTSFKMDTVLLKVLQQGKNVALYQYTDDIKERFFAGEAPGFTPVELAYRSYYDLAAKQEGPTVIENTYQKQLFALSNKYSVLDENQISLIQNAQYRREDLLAIVSRINNISKADFEKSYVVHSKFSFYAGAALNMSQTSSPSVSDYELAGGGNYTSYLPAIKVGVDLLPDPNGKVELRMDVSANFAKFNVRYTLTVEPNTAAEASFNQSSLGLTPQIIYNFYNATDLKFYLGVGMSLTDYDYTNAYFGPPDRNPKAFFPTASYEFQRFNSTFVFKTGFRIHKNVDIFLDYYTATTSTSQGYFQLSNQMTQIGVNYFFGN